MDSHSRLTQPWHQQPRETTRAHLVRLPQPLSRADEQARQAPRRRRHAAGLVPLRLARRIPDGDHGAEAGGYAEELLGTHVYSFGHLFVHAHDNALPRPETMDQLHERLERALYVREYRGSDDTIQVLTDDDETSLAMYWFTDAFAKARPERVAYLLREDWHLPEAVGPGGFKAKPGVNLLLPRLRKKGDVRRRAHLGYNQALEWLSGGEKLPGLRLPDLVPWLLPQRRGDGGAGQRPDPVDHPRGAGHDTQRGRRDRGGLPGRPQGTAGRRGDVERLHRLAGRSGPAARRTAFARPGADVRVGSRAACYRCAALCRTDAGARRRGQGVRPAVSLRRRLASGNVDLANAILDYHGRFNVLDDWDVPNEYGPDVPAGEESGLQ